jgi:hypothetical protein
METMSTIEPRANSLLEIHTPPTTRRPSKVGIELLGLSLAYLHDDNHNHKNQPQFQHIVERIKQGLGSHAPELCDEGVGGTYFMKDDNSRVVAVFKPADEEAHAINNPKHNTNESGSPKKGLTVGEAVIKECAAYLLDKNHFAGVPATCLVKCNHWAFHFWGEDGNDVEQSRSKLLKTKIGSLQQYVDHDCASWDLGPSLFPVTEVHKIGILDVRMLNLDRHGGNILVKHVQGQGFKLVPIDHGYCLPSDIDVEDLFFEWLHWPQAKVPFGEEIISYVNNINIEDDLEMLRQLGLPKENRTVYRVMTTFLKKCVAAGLRLVDIGTMVCRSDPHTPSVVENIYNTAKNAKTGKLMRRIASQMDEAIQQFLATN